MWRPFSSLFSLFPPLARARPFSAVSDMGRVHTTERLESLRRLMKEEHRVDVYVVPSEDQHASEYIASCDERRAFISGFDGSAGCAVITEDEALLFTDGRYFLQAETQLDENWQLMKQGLPDVPSWQEYLNKLKSKRVGVDPTLLVCEEAQTLSKSLANQESTLVPITQNIVDEIWASDRPARPQHPVFHLDVKYSGESHLSKLTRVREELIKEKAKAMVVTALDEIAWLFNLRGSDIPYNPVFFSYAIVTPDSASLFLQTDGVESAPMAPEVLIRKYEDIWSELKSLAANVDGKVLVPKKSSLAIANLIGEDKSHIATSPVTFLKSIKNSTEINGFRECHKRDGAALVRYFAWLEDQLVKKSNISLSEWKAAEKLEGFRSQQDLFQGLSFDTISSTGPNAAIIHYSPTVDDSSVIDKDAIYLCDSGGQYLDGTTDVTRTLHFGEPTPGEKRAFTRVLQGHIAIDTSIFPNGTTGFMLDVIARRALWQDGLDFRHGTGHGVGHFLNVHEGPHGIGAKIAYNAHPLKAGMTITNEPGYYEDGKYGIRIENTMLIAESHTSNNFGGKGYLEFENVTMCPIQTKLINMDLLNADEKSWINSYHKEVLEKLEPILHQQGDILAMEWLHRECISI